MLIINFGKISKTKQWELKDSIPFLSLFWQLSWTKISWILEFFRIWILVSINSF
jgi:hypothetical protein